MKKWKTLSSKIPFDNKWFKVQQDTVKLPNGKIVDDYFMWKEGDIVLIVAMTKNNEVVLVKQYKHASNEVMVEVPAGYVDKENNPESAAKRELEEETGFTSKKFTHIATLTNNPTKVISNIYIYLAKDVEKTTSIKLDETEDIEVIVKPYKEVVKMILNGEIWVTGSISALFLIFKKLQLI